jgi:hypothetical protein
MQGRRMGAARESSMIEQLQAWLGADFRELSGADVQADIPLTTALINRVIAERLAQMNGHISAAVVEPHEGDRVTVHVRPRAAFLPPVEVRLQIAEQPELPASPVIVLRWSLAGGLGVLARMASPALALFKVLPPGVRVDGDLIGIDLAGILREKGFEWVLPFVRELRLATSESGLTIHVRLQR